MSWFGSRGGKGLAKSNVKVASRSDDALEPYRRAAEGGDAEAMNKLGVFYEQGKVVTKNMRKAVDWYKRAADGGDTWGMFNLAACYAHGRGVTKDEQKATYLYSRAAAGGLADAMNVLGERYEVGKGVAKDLEKAVEYYTRAADGEDLWGIYNLARCYASGTGVTKDDKKAAALYKRAADGGHSGAINWLGTFYKVGRGVPRDLQTEVKWSKSASDEEHDMASPHHCNCHASERVAQEDENVAAELVRRAAEGGEVSCMRDLGLRYKQGRGVPRDLPSAAMWFARAAEGGSVDALNDLIQVLHRGGLSKTGVPLYSAKTANTVGLCRQAIQAGRTNAARRMLALLLLHGIDGQVTNRNEAAKMMQRASDDSCDKRDIPEMGKGTALEETNGRGNAPKVYESSRQSISVRGYSVEETTVQRPVEICTAEFDVFISHAGSEKMSVAVPLRNYLAHRGWRCFLDEEELKPSGKTNGEQLLEAIYRSKGAIFILSVDFVSRKWPMRELREFFRYYDKAKEDGRTPPVLIPLFYKLTVEDCKDDKLPYRTETVQIFRENGFFERKRQQECSSLEAADALKRLARFVGFRNDQSLEGSEYAALAGLKVLERVEVGTLRSEANEESEERTSPSRGVLLQGEAA